LKTVLPALLGALALGGCVAPEPPSLYSACKAMTTSNWTAHVELAREGVFLFPDEQALVISGTVQLPSGGYRLKIEDGPLILLDPPVQQVILRTIAPSGMSSQAIVDEQVTGAVPFDGRAKSVSVRCGDGTIAEIPVIEDRRGAPTDVLRNGSAQ